jgi:NhaP-type Na+/H+ or K+/H+ antiporter
MDHFELILLGLLIAVAGLTALARLIDVPYPILLVVGGGFIGFVPGLPQVELDPDLVLLVFLPALLFNAAYFASLHELRRDTRTIVMSSIGLVLLTAAIVAGGIAIGLVVGVVLVRCFRMVTRDVLVGTTLSIVSGYLGYIPAEELGVSGVLAAVTVGLVLGRRSTEISTAAARLSAYSFWEVLVFLLNATLFILVGFQLHTVISEQERSTGTLVLLGLAISGAVIGARLLWLFTTPCLIRALDRRPAQRARRVGMAGRFVLGWMGLRGAVSLAAALALPLDFPERDLIVFLTVCVIYATLVFQGLTLPWLIRSLDIHDDGSRAHEELVARQAATAAAIARMQELRNAEWTRDGTTSAAGGWTSGRERSHPRTTPARTSRRGRRPTSGSCARGWRPRAARSPRCARTGRSPMR